MPILDFLQVGAWHHRGRLAGGWMDVDPHLQLPKGGETEVST